MSEETPGERIVKLEVTVDFHEKMLTGLKDQIEKMPSVIAETVTNKVLAAIGKERRESPRNIKSVAMDHVPTAGIAGGLITLVEVFRHYFK